MISKAKIKYIHSLELKKNRKSEEVFVAEGPKVVGDLLAIMPAKVVVSTKEWIAINDKKVDFADEIIEVSDEELGKVSFLQHPQQVVAVFRQFKKDTHPSDIASQLSLALDGVQDPGNLGTIIRIADWFGIQNIFCSEDTADV
jgi:TrmH family RNA methyltransferase